MVSMELRLREIFFMKNCSLPTALIWTNFMQKHEQTKLLSNYGINCFVCLFEIISF